MVALSHTYVMTNHASVARHRGNGQIRGGTAIASTARRRFQMTLPYTNSQQDSEARKTGPTPQFLRNRFRSGSCASAESCGRMRDGSHPVQGGARTMRKLLLGLGALCMASVAAPAFAQGWGGYDYGRGYYGDDVRRHVRACAQHERFHERLAEEHADEHDEGFYGRSDHRDAHDALDDAHDEYHDEHGGLNHCGYWNRQYYRMLEARPRHYGWYGNGY